MITTNKVRRSTALSNRGWGGWGGGTFWKLVSWWDVSPFYKGLDHLREFGYDLGWEGSDITSSSVWPCTAGWLRAPNFTKIRVRQKRVFFVRVRDGKICKLSSAFLPSCLTRFDTFFFTESFLIIRSSMVSFFLLFISVCGVGCHVMICIKIMYRLKFALTTM